MSMTLVKRRESEYTMFGWNLYKRGLYTPLLKCLGIEEANYALLEVREGVVGQYLEVTVLAKNILRAGYFYTNMVQDAYEYMKK